ncbi:MAG: glycogen debranching protein GlgX [Chloroflexi bacterium]|nr:glycogen debranching protein GlgX [Chloroflexota bacterium]
MCPYGPLIPEPGRPYPLGAAVDADGVNFSIFSANATSVELLLFDSDDSPPSHTFVLDPLVNKTYYYWHIFIPGIGIGQRYAYRVDGPYRPEEGMRFDRSKVLLDPYARGVSYGDNWSRAAAGSSGDNAIQALKAVVTNGETYDWQRDTPLRRPLSQTVIYEMHLRGFTADPSSGVKAPGTFSGMQEKIAYLQELGVTAVELMPITQYDEQEVNRRNPLTGKPLRNYWGYAPIAFFAPHLGYSASGDPLAVQNELRDLVRALHQAGIEVILDVVYNHTAENDHKGPTISFRGLENIAYYMLAQDPRYYRNFSGTGNTVDTNHSVVRRLILDCLRYWVSEFHIDGFRFDLASVFSRGQDGEPISDAPILWEIESDPVLAGTKLIAEAWDASGLYQLGSFTGDRWAEWNGRFRDDVRRFIRGDEDTVRDLAWRLSGSFDIFRSKPSYVSYRSINYITCHDGFTLHDLVSYEKKHNLANGEGNRDGADANYSWNCGVEGPTTDPNILALRSCQMRNLLTILFMARGTPMLLGGDEFARSQGGNNNAYCQDNPVSWYDWRLMESNAGLLRFVRELIALRLRHATLTASYQLGSRRYEEMLHKRLTYHGVQLGQPDWGTKSHSLAVHYHGVAGDGNFYLIVNAYHDELTFALPVDISWRRLIDTAQDSPDDFYGEEEAPWVSGTQIRVGAHSTVVLYAPPRC